MGDFLGLQQASIGLKADAPQSGQVMQSFADIQIVDGRLGSQGAAFLVVPHPFIVHVERGDHAIGDHPGAKQAGVLLVTQRSKMSCTCLGRPMSKFSRITSSKKILPVTGRSRTWVREPGPLGCTIC